MNGTVLGVSSLLLLGGSMAIWFQRIKRVQIPEDRRRFVAVWLFAASLGAYALTLEPGWLGGFPASLSVFGGLLFTVLFFISPQKVAEDVVRVGERLKDFTALDEDGNEFAIASTAGHPVLIKFFRGHW